MVEMEEESSLRNDSRAKTYDAAGRPLGFVAGGGTTALICEEDEARRGKISSRMRASGYQTREPASAREALANMRFHLYDVVIVNEAFDRSDQEVCPVLSYLESLAMATRRQIFVALLSDTYRTADNMVAFVKSVNIIISTQDLDEVDKIIAQSKADNEAFYHVFKESMVKAGKI